MKILNYVILGGPVLFFATIHLANAQSPAEPTNEEIRNELKASFAPVGNVGAERLDQSEEQKICSEFAETGKAIPQETVKKLLAQALASVKPPSDDNYLGDWKVGEKIAQSGVGFQFSDKPGTVAGGNCYACHQLKRSEMAFGNIGPSLLGYGKHRGNARQTLEYAWNKIYNSHAYTVCSTMPRFGSAHILTEQQLKDVMALLFDPSSPVNNE